jgi:DNA-binding LacI/PurR family transcriptional regulator
VPEVKTLSQVKIVDVAECAGVSMTTASRMLNWTGPVAKVTAAQVQAAITVLHYTPIYFSI